jgi:hypothetical protein
MTDLLSYWRHSKTLRQINNIFKLLLHKTYIISNAMILTGRTLLCCILIAVAQRRSQIKTCLAADRCPSHLATVHRAPHPNLAIPICGVKTVRFQRFGRYVARDIWRLSTVMF